MSITDKIHAFRQHEERAILAKIALQVAIVSDLREQIQQFEQLNSLFYEALARSRELNVTEGICPRCLIYNDRRVGLQQRSGATGMGEATAIYRCPDECGLTLDI